MHLRGVVMRCLLRLVDCWQVWEWSCTDCMGLSLCQSILVVQDVVQSTLLHCVSSVKCTGRLAADCFAGDQQLFPQPRPAIIRVKLKLLRASQSRVAGHFRVTVSQAAYGPLTDLNWLPVG